MACKSQVANGQVLIARTGRRRDRLEASPLLIASSPSSICLSREAMDGELALSFVREEANFHADVSRPFWTFAFHDDRLLDDNLPRGGTFHKSV